MKIKFYLTRQILANLVKAISCIVFVSIFLVPGKVFVDQNHPDTQHASLASDYHLPAYQPQSAIDTNQLKQSDWYSAAIKNIEQSEYEFSKVDSFNRYSTPNRKNNFRFYYDENGFSVQPRITKIPVGDYDPLKNPEEIKYKILPDWKVRFDLDKKQTGKGEWVVAGNKAEYKTNNITVQYINNEEGMRQNFIVQKPLSAGDDLRLNFSVKTKLKQQFNSERLQFVHAKSGAVLNYEGLKVWDANGRLLAAAFEKNNSDYSIHVNTRNAVYPVTVDPISSIPNTALESNRNNAQMGTSVASAGDVNKDGFNDIIVGVPFYSNGQTNEGAAFIYLGSATGFRDTPNTILESNQAGAQMGFSVCGAGDLDKDGYNDVVVGAPNYNDGGGAGTGVAYVYYGSGNGIANTRTELKHINLSTSKHGYSLSAGDINGDGFRDVLVGAPYNGNPNIQGGAVNIYYGSVTRNAVRTPDTSLHSNTANNLMGWSLSCTNLNGDNFDDVIAGAPETWSIVNPTPQAGAFFVYYGSATGVSAPLIVKAKHEDMQLGGSVASAGDTNGDGFNDLIVGAPAYAYKVGNTLESERGAFFIYHGSSTGIDTASASVQVIVSPQLDAKLGQSVAGAGDVNGDGYDDVIVGAPGFDNNLTNVGAIYIYHGSVAGLNTTPGIAEGQWSGAQLGFSVAGIGDINRDGLRDVIAGAPFYTNGESSEGAVFIFSGVSAKAPEILLITGSQAGAQMGFSVAGAGDVNGDGYSDVIVGAPFYDFTFNNEGAAFIYYGSSTGIGNTWAKAISNAEAGAQMGFSVSGAGDVNGDGYSDVIIGAPFSKTGSGTVNAAGIALIFYGSAGGLTSSNVLSFPQGGATMGSSVASAGDINGDGYSDVIIGAPFFNLSLPNQGIALIYYGSSTGITFPPAVLQNDQSNAKMGSCVAGAGDVNGDGYSDVMIGAPGYTNIQANEGAALIYYGSATGIVTTPASIVESNRINDQMGQSVASAGDINGDGYSDVIIGDLNYSNSQTNEGAALIYYGAAVGINTSTPVILESNQAGAKMGASVATAGDVDDDGYSDVVVGTPFYDNVKTDQGAAFIFHGSSVGINIIAADTISFGLVNMQLGSAVAGVGDINGDGFSDVIAGVPHFTNDAGAFVIYKGAAAGINTTAAITFESNQSSAQMGYSVSGAGDVNGDGYSDVIMGSPFYDNGEIDEGAVFIYHGSANGLSLVPNKIAESNQVNARMGVSVSGAGDVNGDGYGDIIVGVLQYDHNETDEGAAFIYYGSSGGINITVPTIMESNQGTAQMGNAVAAAGDINGDGYNDVIVGSSSYNGAAGIGGAVFIGYGSEQGINTTTVTKIESGQVSASLGFSVSGAGDVNGDGFGDIIVGALNYSSAMVANEGAAFIYHGSGTGINTTFATRLENNQVGSQMGNSVAGVGDLNGDGYSDVIVGARLYDNGETNEGAVFIYYGSSSGVTTTGSARVESNQGNAQMGYSVSGAGDVNGDGYSDIITGARLYDNVQFDEGAAFIYHGSTNGINTTAAAIIKHNQADARMGFSVSGAGDVNGDGYSDVIVGTPFYDNGQFDEGAVSVYYGHGAIATSIRNNLTLYNSNLTTPLNKNNFARPDFGAGLFAKSFLGRGKGKLVWETRFNYNPYSGTPITNSMLFTSQQSSYTDLGRTGAELKSVVAKQPVAAGKYTKIRARVKYNPATAITGQLYGPWRYVPAQIAGHSLGVLPVDLISFKASWQQEGRTASIEFTVDNESSISHYEIEKSSDGFNYTKIASIAAINTSALHTYSYIDDHATGEKQYYRLKTIHSGGDFDYSNIQLLLHKAVMEILVFPNPAIDVLQLRLNYAYGKINVRIVNISGQVVKQISNLSTANQTISIPVSSLASGTYFLQLDAGGEKQVLQFVKQ